VGYTIDVDIGGTLTDGLFSDGQRAEMVKVDTTPHDFTICFFECLNEGARRFGYDELAPFLQEVAVIRWSSTIATNVVAERKGPKLGLLVSGGPIENLYGTGPSPAIGFLVAPQHVEVVRTPLDRADILQAARQLLERGARRICLSLAGAHLNPHDERLAKAWIEEQYPDHYLGSVPVLLGSDMLHHPDDQTRTHLALINAYVHTPLATSLFKAEDEILHMRYRHPIYVGHVNGGVARISKTKGVDTTESGPIFGLAASAYFARAYGFERVLSLDVGGTTSKIGLVEDGEPAMADRGDVFGIGLQVPWIVLHSLAIGGGSVARADGSRVTLGPQSMGAYPGPACYDLGGQRPTLTDALLTAGLLNPDRFLGGRRRLDVGRARRALDDDVARPLGVTVEQAALQVIGQAVSQIAEAAEQLPGGAAQSLLFAFGGNGANLAVAAAERLHSPRALVFQLGPVFSAFGSSVSMIRHVEESWP
jgi:N-methylhydantoinase A